MKPRSQNATSSWYTRRHGELHALNTFQLCRASMYWRKRAGGLYTATRDVLTPRTPDLHGVVTAIRDTPFADRDHLRSHSKAPVTFKAIHFATN